MCRIQKRLCETHEKHKQTTLYLSREPSLKINSPFSQSVRSRNEQKTEVSFGTMATGTLLLTGSRLVFFASGYFVHVFLARYLQPRLYGVWGVILGILTVYQMILFAGPMKAVSKFTAEHADQARSIQSQGLKIQIIFAGILGVFIGISAPWISRLLKDVTLTPYIYATVFFLPVYAMYAVYLGTLNGLRAFDRQALVMTTYSILRTLGIVGLVLLGYRIYGAIGGGLIAMGIAILIARHFSTCPAADHAFEGRRIVRFAFPVSLFALALAAFLNLDIFFVKALLGSNEQVGFYTAAAVLVKVPYLLLFGLSSALFPSVARSLKDPANSEAKFYIERSLRYALLIVTPIAFVTAATSKELVSLLYTSHYLPAAEPLRILMFGYVFASLFLMASTIIMAVGKPKITMGLAFLMVGIVVVLNYTLIPRLGLSGAALATLLAGFIGTSGGLAFIFRRFGRLMNLMSPVKIVGASVAISLPSVFLDIGGVWLLIYYGILIVLYGVVLALLKEVGAEEWSVLRGVFDPRAVRERRNRSS